MTKAKILRIGLICMVAVGLMGCGSQNDNATDALSKDATADASENEVTFETFVQALKEAGGDLEVEEDDKPFFDMIDADDGWMLEYNDSTVKVYLYEDEKAYKEALKNYSVMEDFIKRDNLVLETESEEAKEIFNSMDPAKLNEVLAEKANTKDTVYQVGETATLDKWDVTLNSVSFEQSVNDSFYKYTAEEGNKYLVLKLNVKSNGVKGKNFTDIGEGVDLTAYYNGKYEYGMYFTDLTGDLSRTYIEPLTTTDGFIVFEVPNSVADATEGIVVKMDQNMETISWQIR